MIARVRQTVSIDSSSQAGKERTFLEREAQPARATLEDVFATLTRAEVEESAGDESPAEEERA